MISAAEAPSVSGEELPGVMRQSISGKRSASASVRNAGLQPGERLGGWCAGRTVSSVERVDAAATGTISVANAPDSPAAAASRCDRAANSSSSSRSKPHFAAMSSAQTPWLTRPVGVARAHARAVRVGARRARADRHAAHRLDAAGDDDVGRPASTPCAAKCAACWLDPHCRSIVVPGTCSGKPAASTALRVML